MIYFIRKYVTRFILFVSFCTAIGCHSKSSEVRPVYDAYHFDSKVIDKLPVYDSLALAVLEKYSLFRAGMDDDGGYNAFTFMPGSYDENVCDKLPPEAGTAINQYYNQLGKDFIYGFALFKDSTVKIYVRNKASDTHAVDIAENLSFYPVETNIRRREFPDKDSILNKHWQYWARFTKQGLF